MPLKQKYMLNKLFGSTSRVKILKLFFSHPEKQYYIRQISRHLKLQLNSARRELENLENFGLLVSSWAKDEEAVQKNYTIEKKISTSKKKAEKKYFKLDKDFVLYEEIKALLLKAQVLYEKNFSDKVLVAGKPKLLLLTGYFVSSNDTPTDVLLVGRLNKQKISKIILELEKELGREINYTLMSLEEFKYRRDITDVFLYSILENKKIVVIDELGAVI